MSEFGDDLDRGGVQVPRAGVIAESLPQFEHIIDGCAGERIERGEPIEEAVEIRNHRLDSRLLQHHFAQPHAVRRTIVSPRQIAGIRSKPVE